MYFESRPQAGQVLADKLSKKYRFENCAVIALNDGAVEVAEQIAASLHSVLMLLLTEDIEVPGESVKFGSVSQEGDFTYNSSFSDGEIDEYSGEFHGYLEEQKREAFQRMNRLLGDGGTINQGMLREHMVILVSDGVDDVSSISVAIDFLKPIRIKGVVIATPLASVKAVDRMHVLADDLYVLSVRDNFMGANHYYEDNKTASREENIAKINKIILNWR